MKPERIDAIIKIFKRKAQEAPKDYRTLLIILRFLIRDNLEQMNRIDNAYREYRHIQEKLKHPKTTML